MDLMEKQRNYELAEQLLAEQNFAGPPRTWTYPAG